VAVSGYVNESSPVGRSPWLPTSPLEAVPPRTKEDLATLGGTYLEVGPDVGLATQITIEVMKYPFSFRAASFLVDLLERFPWERSRF
jgi:hypothetical protein